jgi:pimeloyl-ACP methyl ester carboxylesterase
MDNESGRVRDEIVTLDGLRFHYRDWGDLTAPPVVVLHGYTQHAHSWVTVARALADRFRVLALDQRGFGESDWGADYHELRLVADLAGFVEALGLPTVSLVGFSIGGSAAISYAQLYPDRVERLVAFECFTDPDVSLHMADADHVLVWLSANAHIVGQAHRKECDGPAAGVLGGRHREQVRPQVPVLHRYG